MKQVANCWPILDGLRWERNDLLMIQESFSAHHWITRFPDTGVEAMIPSSWTRHLGWSSFVSKGVGGLKQPSTWSYLNIWNKPNTHYVAMKFDVKKLKTQHMILPKIPNQNNFLKKLELFFAQGVDCPHRWSGTQGVCSGCFLHRLGSQC